MALRTGIPPIPTVREIGKARKAFHQREPRNLFYRVATELIDLSIRKATTLSVSEALSVLLQTWNKSFYRFHDGFSEKHLRKNREPHRLPLDTVRRVSAALHR